VALTPNEFAYKLTLVVKLFSQIALPASVVGMYFASAIDIIIALTINRMSEFLCEQPFQSLCHNVYLITHKIAKCDVYC
jgi:hypothetical protein